MNLFLHGVDPDDDREPPIKTEDALRNELSARFMLIAADLIRCLVVKSRSLWDNGFATGIKRASPTTDWTSGHFHVQSSSQSSTAARQCLLKIHGCVFSPSFLITSDL
jgi:hypothetical protein